MAREVPEICEAYKKAKKAGSYARPGLIHIQLAPRWTEGGELAELKTIRLPDGFPKTPFLKTDYAVLGKSPRRRSRKKGRLQNASKNVRKEWAIFPEFLRSVLAGVSTHIGEPIESKDFARVLPSIARGDSATKLHERLTSKRFRSLKMDFRFSRKVLEGRFSTWLKENWIKQPDGIKKWKRSANLPEPIQTVGPEGSAIVQVDFRASQYKLKTSFKTWLEKNWKKQPSPKSKKGRSAQKTECAALRALSVYRLSHKRYGDMTADAGMSYSQEHSKDKAPLFQNEPDWYDAKKRAKEAIQAIRESFIRA